MHHNRYLIEDDVDDQFSRVATNDEALNEFAHNAGMDNPDRCWLLHDRDIWVKNPFYRGEPQPHPEDEGEHRFLEPVLCMNILEAEVNEPVYERAR